MTLRTKPPKYCHDRGSGQAFVRIGGRTHYLGRYGSRESKAKYARPTPKPNAGPSCTATARPRSGAGIDRGLIDVGSPKGNPAIAMTDRVTDRQSRGRASGLASRCGRRTNCDTWPRRRSAGGSGWRPPS
jgi:hypothetical protein